MLTAYRNIDSVKHVIGGFAPGQNYLAAAHVSAMTTRSALEKQINEWLAAIKGRLVSVSQSESEHPTAGHHVTVCVWYIPSE